MQKFSQNILWKYLEVFSWDVQTNDLACYLWFYSIIHLHFIHSYSIHVHSLIHIGPSYLILQSCSLLLSFQWVNWSFPPSGDLLMVRHIATSRGKDHAKRNSEMSEGSSQFSL